MFKSIYIYITFATIFYSRYSRMNKIQIYNIFDNKVAVKKLENGMNIVAMSGENEANKKDNVSIRLVFNVGSYVEESEEKGYSHLIEHMIFKGGKNFKGSEFQDSVNSLGGACRAFTSFDKTCFIIDGPKKHAEAFSLLLQKAIEGVLFLEEDLALEMQVVIQELRDRNMNYIALALNKLMEITFPNGHPYHDPTLGYIPVLANANSKRLLTFYKKYFVANNATFFISGDIEVESFVEKVSTFFYNFKKGSDIKKPLLINKYNVNKKDTIISGSNEGFSAVLSWGMPGYLINENIHYISKMILSLLNQVLNSSLIHKEKIATFIECAPQILAHDSYIYIYFKCHEENYEKVLDLINLEIKKFLELNINFNYDTVKKNIAEFDTNVSLIEDVLELSSKESALLTSFIAYGNFNNQMKLIDNIKEVINKEKINDFLKTYMLNIPPNIVKIVPCDKKNKHIFLDTKKKDFVEENLLLKRFKRMTSVKKIAAIDSIAENFDSYTLEMLKPYKININNFDLFTYFKERNSPHAYLNFKDKVLNDKEQILLNLAINMLFDVNSKFTRQDLFDFVDLSGSSISINSNGIYITSSKENFAAAISKCFDALKYPVFNQSELDKYKNMFIDAYKSRINNQLSINQEHINKLFLGEDYLLNVEMQELIQNCTLEEVNTCYYKFINPENLQMIICGDFNKTEIIRVIKENLIGFKGKRQKINCSKLKNINNVKNIKINTDSTQCTIRFAKLLPIKFNDNDFAKILLLQELLCGELGSINLSSKFIKLRNETGLFYAFNVNFFTSIAGYKNFKMATMDFITSIDKKDLIIKELHIFMEDLIKTGFSQIELDTTKKNIFSKYNAIKDSFYMASEKALDNYQEYGDTCAQLKFWDKIKNITLTELNEALKKYLDLKTFSTCIVGDDVDQSIFRKVINYLKNKN